MRLIRIWTGILFVLLAALGLWIASQRPLWNDEYYSLIYITLGQSYKAILIGLHEGGNSPLSFVLQKAQCDLFSYHLPQEWVKGHWEGTYVFDQFFLRIQSVVFMSAALSAVFYYFGRRHSWGMGLYALAVTMTSFLFWIHWTEARPYAEWFALSLFQILFLLNILEGPADQNKKSWYGLVFIHWLLALTSIISAVQITAAGAVLWMFRRPRLLWYVPLVLLPLGICGFYYIHSPQYLSYFVDGPVALINANISKDRLFFIFMSALVLIVQCRGKDWKAHLEIKYLAFFLLMLGGFGLLLLKLKYGQGEGQKILQISNRYFLSLTPAGIVGTVLLSEYLIRAFPSRVWRAAAIVILAGFLVFRAYRTIQLVPNQILPTGLEFIKS
ncbi:MAG: hypothetical protein Q7K71_03170 [Candidatus Omnitrophota bacterium]|nr:hypothetical protein [Candidatus Omnitrophota bacterium]